MSAGDVSLLPSGHDAWVVGNEPAIVVDFQGMVDYAKATNCLQISYTVWKLKTNCLIKVKGGIKMAEPLDAVMAFHNAFRNDMTRIDAAALNLARGKKDLEARLNDFSS